MHNWTMKIRVSEDWSPQNIAAHSPKGGETTIGDLGEAQDNAYDRMERAINAAFYAYCDEMRNIGIFTEFDVENES